MPDLDTDLRDALRELAGEVHPTMDVPPHMLRRARRRRLRTVAVAAATAGLMAYGGVAGANLLRGLGPRPVPSPASRSATPSPTPTPSPANSPSPADRTLPEAVHLQYAFQFPPGPLAASGGTAFTFFPQEGKTGEPSGLIVARMQGPRGITTHRLSDPLAVYFVSIAAGGRSVYLSTRVIQRQTQASDEVVRLDADTLSVAARVTMPQPVIDLVSDGTNLWAELETQVLRLDPSSLAVLATYSVEGASPFPTGTSSFSSLAAGPGGLFATFGNAERTTLYRFDPHSLSVRSRRAIPRSGQGIVVTANAESAWIVGQGYVWKLRPDGMLEGEATAIDGLEAAVAQGGGLAGLVTGDSGLTTFVQIDRSGVVIARSEIGDTGSGLVVDARFLWAARGNGLARWLLLDPNP